MSEQWTEETRKLLETRSDDYLIDAALAELTRLREENEQQKATIANLFRQRGAAEAVVLEGLLREQALEAKLAEARATKDMHKERQEELQVKLAEVQTELDVARSAFKRIGQTNTWKAKCEQAEAKLAAICPVCNRLSCEGTHELTTADTILRLRAELAAARDEIAYEQERNANNVLQYSEQVRVLRKALQAHYLAGACPDCDEAMGCVYKGTRNCDCECHERGPVYCDECALLSFDEQT